MMVRVIYRDQTAGVVERHLLEELIRKGRIVAFHGTDRWIPVDGKNADDDTIVKDLAGRNRQLRGYEAR